MLRKANVLYKNIWVALFIVLSIAIQIEWLTLDNGSFTVVISSGVAAGFYASFGRKVLPSIVIGSIVGTFLFSMILGNISAFDAAMFTLPITFLNIATALLFTLLINFFDCKIPTTLNKGIFFLISMILTVIAISILPAFQLSFLNNNTFWFELKEIIIPTLIGLFVFGTTIVLSNHYDSLLNYKSVTNYKDILYVIIFTVLTYLIFSSDIDGFNFASFGALFIILFIINAYMFNYRMLIYSSLIYIIIYNIVYFKILEVSDYPSTITSLNLYLIILLLITIFTKILIHNISEKNLELNQSKNRFEGMMKSTLNLIKIQDTLDYSNESFKHNYVKMIFDIVTQIFHRVGNVIAAIQTDDEIDVVATKGYDIDYIKSWHIKSKDIDWEIYEPAFTCNSAEYYKRLYGERYNIFKDDFPKVRESVRFLIKLSSNEHAVIIFDILETERDSFTPNDIKNIHSFQNLINSFYEMNELTIKNNNLRDDIVLSLIRTLELYDQYTGGHSEDVAILSKMIAEEMSLSDKLIYDVYWAGIVHDIGKIGISSDIINKSSKLTLEEYKQVQDHPKFGYEILKKSSDLKDIAKLVRHHHEWWNGSGYPSGLAGSEIPLGAQILQVADSVSSMATKRSYTKGKTFEEIIDELEMYSGTQFNPNIARIMIRLIKSGRVKDHFKERM